MDKILAISMLLLANTGLAQEKTDTTSISLAAYADGYYSYYTKASEVAYQVHDAVGAYHNNFGLNVGQVTGAYQSKNLRGVITVHAGDIPAIAWANNYRNLQEANAGVRLANGLWLDMGFFKTHVGTESFLPKDNLMSIITLATFYGPFYQSGARLSYDTETDWHVELHAINGYNLHIDNNDYKTFGALVSHDFGEHFGMSYSAMAGQENVGQLDDAYLVYQNIYADLAYEKLDVQIGLDVAMANQWKTGIGWLPDPLIAGLATAKYHISEKFAIAGRAEIFSDKSSINSMRLSPSVNNFSGSSENIETIGMTIYGGTVGLEFAPSKNGFLRIESRLLYDPGANFSEHLPGYSVKETGTNPMLNSRAQIMATAGFNFNKTFKLAR